MVTQVTQSLPGVPLRIGNFMVMFNSFLFTMKNLVYLMLSMSIFFSCTGKKEELKDIIDVQTSEMKSHSAEGYELLKNQCYICHSPISSSHDEIIAPPMAAVKMRYGRIYRTRDEFIEAIVSWTLNPDPEKALMRGAVDRFKQMPKQEFKQDDMRKIAIYVYDNKLEEPHWFDAHQKEMHANGKGAGRGMP